MLLFNDCNHSVICDDCYKILLDYNKAKKEQSDIDDTDNLLKCPYCNESIYNTPTNIEYL